MKVKIIGAGSAGIHLTQACRRMGWAVWIFDKDPKAFERLYGIYSGRYGKWDDAIHVFKSTVNSGPFADIIMIATPPDVRMRLAIDAIKEKPKLLHLEKPLCTPDLKGVAEFETEMKNHPDTIVTVGYNHAVSKSIIRVIDLLQDKVIGEALTIDVEFREHWKGIFAAHPWLSGPHDNYLGFWARGGGAGGEHSHALHLWLTLARRAWGKRGTVSNVVSKLEMVSDIFNEYDKQARFLIEVEGRNVGGVVQDVITSPPRKWARIQGTEGFIEWYVNGDPTGDLVMYETEYKNAVEIFPKKRQDDFFCEIQHYAILLDGEKHCKSLLDYKYGREVMEILNKAYYSR